MERTNDRAARDWSAPDYTRAVEDSQQLEALMRSILKLFAEGCLVYRDRGPRRSGSVLDQSAHLKRIRRNLTDDVRVA